MQHNIEFHVSAKHVIYSTETKFYANNKVTFVHTVQQNQPLKMFYVRNRKCCKRTAGVIIPIIRNFLVFVSMWLSY
jgi:hypothetical protein